MRAKQILAVVVLLFIAFLIVFPPLVAGNVKVVVSSSSPVSVEHLYVTIGDIKAHRAGITEPSGWISVSNNSRQIDLAAVNASQTIALGSLSLGDYDAIRVRVTNTTVVANNTAKKVPLSSSVFTIFVKVPVQFGAETTIALQVTPVLENTPNGFTVNLTFTAAPKSSGT